MVKHPAVIVQKLSCVGRVLESEGVWQESSMVWHMASGDLPGMHHANSIDEMTIHALRILMPVKVLMRSTVTMAVNWVNFCSTCHICQKEWDTLLAILQVNLAGQQVLSCTKWAAAKVGWLKLTTLLCGGHICAQDNHHSSLHLNQYLNFRWTLLKIRRACLISCLICWMPSYSSPCMSC